MDWKFACICLLITFAIYILYCMGDVLTDIYNQMKLSHETLVKITKNQEVINRSINSLDINIRRSSKKSMEA